MCEVLWLVCLSVCPRAYLKTARPNFTKFFVGLHVLVCTSRGSVLLWRPCDHRRRKGSLVGRGTGHHGGRRARANKCPSGPRGRAPWSGSRAKPPAAESFEAIARLKEGPKLTSLSTPFPHKQWQVERQDSIYNRFSITVINCQYHKMQVHCNVLSRVDLLTTTMIVNVL